MGRCESTSPSSTATSSRMRIGPRSSVSLQPQPKHQAAEAILSQASTLAKTSRENLAAALNALQTTGNVPDSLMAVADPIAEAMGALHRIERSQGADLS